MKFSKLKSISYLLAFTIFASSATITFAQSVQPPTCLELNNTLIQADIQSRRIPAGTKIKVRMENSLNTLSSINGDHFSATIIKDITVDNNMVIPAGTIVRGTVSYIKKTKYPYIGAQMLLTFDHLVTPVGKHVPIAANISGIKNLTDEGGIKAEGSYFKQVSTHFNDGVDVVKEATDLGFDAGESFWNGYPVIVTVPFAAAGGVCIGTTSFVLKSVTDLFHKGNDVVISAGQYLEITLNQHLDIPVN